MLDFDWIPPLRSPRKPRKAEPVDPRLRELYYEARRAMFKREYPGQEYFDKPMPDVRTTNGTTRYIEDVINNLGHHAERISNQGVFRNGMWTTGGGTNGSPDIHCIVNGRPWLIEIKNKDKMSKAQVKYADKMQRLGVLHSVIYVGGLDEFWDELNRILKL